MTDNNQERVVGQIPLPEHLPAEFRTAYVEFAMALLIQRLLVVNKLGVAQAEKVLFFLAAKCSEQLETPEAIVQIGQGLVNQYVATTQEVAQRLELDPVQRVRASAMNKVVRSMHVAQDRNRPLEVRIKPEDFGFSIEGGIK